jgi:hypothetical protein
MSRFTKGPWTEDMIGAVYRRSSGTYHNQLMVEIRGGDTRSDHEGAANAALITAAPELLAALERVEMVFTFMGTMSAAGKKSAIAQARDQAQSAIAKATGKVLPE